ncbi:MAG TPA: SGNH/GDSL hydrolase family protein [Candidatus Polarisedimenticolia bacterium]
MTPRRRVRLAGWTLIVLAPILLFGLIEGGVRLFDIQPSIDREAALPVWLDRNILVKESRWIDLLSGSPKDLRNYYLTYRWDRYLFYRLQPNLDLAMTDITAPAQIRGRTRWVFHTNAKGFNTPDVIYEKPPGTFRIVTLGDSSTFGWGVDTDRIYPHVLRDLLSRRHPGRAIEVVNLGVCGYSSQQGRVLLRREALPYRPDVLVFSYGSNDYSLVPEPFDEVYERNLGWSGALREILNHSRAYQVYAALLAGRTGERARGSQEAPGAGGVLNVGPDKSRENLIQMARFADERGIDPIFVTNCVPGDMSAPMREAASEKGVPLVDTEALLRASIDGIRRGERFGEELFYYRGLYGARMIEEFPWLAVYLTDECHPNVIGHRILAEALVPVVEATPSFERFASVSP